MMKRVGIFLIVVLALASWVRADYIVVAYPFCELLQYDDDGNYVGIFTAVGAVASGTSITADPSGRVYYGNVSGVVSRFDDQGAWDHWYQQQASGQIYGLVARDDAVFVSDAPNNVVVKFDPAQSAGGGVVLGSGSSLVSSPQGMCQDDTGRIYVTNGGNGSVLRWNPDGTFDTELIAPGGAPNCTDVAIGDDGYLWVLRVMARQLSYLVRFNLDGSYAGMIRTLDAASGIEYPNNVYVSPYGKMMVTASTGIHVYDAVGDSWSTFIALGSGGLSAPYGIVHVGEVIIPTNVMAHGRGIVVDGDLSEWNEAEWIALDQAYVNDTGTDIVEASYAVNWGDNGNKIYVAVKVRDQNHFFIDTYDGWNTRDAVEIYLHTTGTGPTDFSTTQADAQQYSIGITSDLSSVWTALGNNNAVPAAANFQAAGDVDGEWIYYEAALTPYKFFSLDGNGLIVSQLQADDFVGFDVVVAGKDGSGGDFEMRSANLVMDKSVNYNNFQRYQLAEASAIPGDANGDGLVDVGDLGILAANYGGTDKSWAEGDFNGDGLVDVGDLGILAANYGTGSSSADWEADYAQAFGEIAADVEADDVDGSICGALGLPLIAGLLLIGLMLVKLEE